MVLYVRSIFKLIHHILSLYLLIFWKTTCSAKDYEISELIDECLVKNKKKAIPMLNEFNASIEDNILILKSFLFKLKRLKKLKEEIASNKNQDQVLSLRK